jgi:hypothetical protein
VKITNITVLFVPIPELLNQTNAHVQVENMKLMTSVTVAHINVKLVALMITVLLVLTKPEDQFTNVLV